MTSNLIDFEKFSNRSWQFTYDRKMSFQRIRLFHNGYCNELSEFFGVQIDSEVYRIKNDNVFVYYDQTAHDRAFKKISELLNGPESLVWIQKIKQTIIEYYSEFIVLLEQKPTDYTSFANEELADAFTTFTKENDRISLPTWLLYLYIEEILTSELAIRLSKSGLNPDEVAEILGIVAVPQMKTPLDVYQRDLYEISLLDDEYKKAALILFAEKYAHWGVYDVNFSEQRISDHESKIENLSKADAKHRIEEIDTKYKTYQHSVDVIVDRFAKNENVKVLLDLYLYYVNFKDWKNYYREQSSYKIKFLFGEIAKRISLTPKQISFMTAEEVGDSLNKSAILKTEAINARMTNSAIVYLSGIEYLITDAKLLEEIDTILQTSSVREIQGLSAFKGVVEGTVKLIFSPEDAKNVQEGDILVSSTTRPDYLAFMKRAAGFITNEGGMLSHAAIMARELKKPCVIGTKIATTVLKEGMKVRLDADKGIVEILAD